MLTEGVEHTDTLVNFPPISRVISRVCTYLGQLRLQSFLPRSKERKIYDRGLGIPSHIAIFTYNYGKKYITITFQTNIAVFGIDRKLISSATRQKNPFVAIYNIKGDMSALTCVEFPSCPR